MVMERTDNLPHYGGQMGMAVLLCMLSLTGCMAFTDQTGSLSFFPSWTQSQYDAPQLIQAQGVVISAPAATFIVRFNDEPELEQVCRNFRRDEAGTRAAFQRWAADYRQLQGLQLVRASYSGERIAFSPSVKRSSS